MKKSRPGTSTYNSLKRRAMQLMKQRKMYDQQLGQMMDMEFNMSNMVMATEQMEMTKQMVDGMRTTAQVMKKAQKHGKMDIGSIEKLQDELSDMMEDAQEIQEIMGQSYGCALQRAGDLQILGRGEGVPYRVPVQAAKTDGGLRGGARSVPDDCDEDDLMAELDMLEDEIVQEDLMGSMPDTPPAYVAQAAEPSADDELEALEGQMAL